MEERTSRTSLMGFKSYDEGRFTKSSCTMGMCIRRIRIKNLELYAIKIEKLNLKIE